MKKLVLLIILILFIPVQVKAEIKNHHLIRAEYIMGTIYKIEVYDNDISKAEKAISQAFKEIRDCDKILSDYRKDSELTKVLEEASSHPVKVSDYFFEITERSIYFSKITNGLFDITVQPLVDLWGFKNKEFKKPTDLQIKKVKEFVGYKNIILDSQNKTIFIKDPRVKMDFGAIGKGFAVDKALKILKKNNIKSAFIDSVSNQYYLGTPPNNKYWKVGIKDARNNQKIIKYLYLKDKTVSTSGDYEQFFIENGQRFTHIINPITGYPIKEAIASTIISDNATDADALSTSVLLLNEKQSNDLIKLFPNSKLIRVKDKIFKKQYL